MTTTNVASSVKQSSLTAIILASKEAYAKKVSYKAQRSALESAFTYLDDLAKRVDSQSKDPKVYQAAIIELVCFLRPDYTPSNNTLSPKELFGCVVADTFDYLDTLPAMIDKSDKKTAIAVARKAVLRAGVFGLPYKKLIALGDSALVEFEIAKAENNEVLSPICDENTTLRYFVSPLIDAFEVLYAQYNDAVEAYRIKW